MAKKLMGYQEGIGELMKGFDEDRVILVGRGKQGPPNPMTIGWGRMGILWRKPIFTVFGQDHRVTPINSSRNQEILRSMSCPLL